MDAMEDSRTELERYSLRDIHETGREIGRGSYATVVELDYKGLRCVGKKIHTILYEGQEDVHLRRFEEECRLLSQLSHPHIVQFLGIYFEKVTNAPVLVMEFLPMTLTECLGRYGIMPDEISFSILQDITLGLRYLHERDHPIIHRDLSANNVLLTLDMSAKISDLGVAKILQLANPTQLQTMSKTPGTSCYMPPEAMVEKARYNLKVDTFSFGVMMVHVLSGCWPFPGEAVRTNPNNPSELIAVSEFDRRETTIKLINDIHPLMPLIKQCLNNSPSLRPTVFEIYTQVSVVANDNPLSFSNRVIMLETIQTFRKQKETVRIEKEELRASMDVILTQRDDAVSKNTLLTSQIAEIHRQMSDLKNETEQLRMNIYEKQQEMDAKKKELLCKEAALVSRCDSLKKELDQALVIKDLDFFTHGIKFSSTRCAIADVSVRVPGVCTYRAVSFGNGAYIELNQRYLGPLGISTAFSGVSSELLHYNYATNTWRTLPFPPVKDYNLGYLFDKLVLVGGHMIADVYEFDEASQQWIKSTAIPPMRTARSLATVATWTTPEVSALILCGGKDHRSKTMADVEVFHSTTSQWHTALSLPLPRHDMKHIVIQNTLYLVGGEKITRKCSVFSISIPDLLESSLQQTDQSNCWQTLPDIPSTDCFPVTLNGYLLAVEQQKAAVYTYCPLFASWIKLGSLPFSDTYYSVVEAIITSSISSKELLVIGSRLSPPGSKMVLPTYTTTMHFTANKVKLTL